MLLAVQAQAAINAQVLSHAWMRAGIVRTTANSRHLHGQMNALHAHGLVTQMAHPNLKALFGDHHGHHLYVQAAASSGASIAPLGTTPRAFMAERVGCRTSDPTTDIGRLQSVAGMEFYEVRTIMAGCHRPVSKIPRAVSIRSCDHQN